MKREHQITSFLFILILFIAPKLLAANGDILERIKVTLPEDFIQKVLEKKPEVSKYLNATDVYAITYESDGLKIKGYIIIPKGEGPFPCLIVNRGGNRDFGAISDKSATLWLGEWSQWGYIVVASQLRGVEGGEGVEEFGGAEIDDILNLIPLLGNEPKADTSRIAMWGGSRGGLMTYLALTHTDKIKAAAITAGLSDSYDMIEQRPGMETVYEELVPDWKENRIAALDARSPIRWVDKLCKTTPLLLLQGTSDWRVNPMQSIRMAQKLYEVKHPFRFIVYEGADHGLSQFQKEEAEQIRAFFDRYVRDREPLPNLEPQGR